MLCVRWAPRMLSPEFQRESTAIVEYPIMEFAYGNRHEGMSISRTIANGIPFFDGVVLTFRNSTA